MWEWLRNFSAGVWTIMGVAVISSMLVLSNQNKNPEGIAFWTSARNHHKDYTPLIAQWNAEHSDSPINPLLLAGGALERRLLSGFMSGTPVADFFEINQSITARVISGPPEDIGLMDLTDRLQQDGLLKTINRPSFSPWTMRGRIYGFPHDVHPVLLAYRADIVEKAGIDVQQIETWDDFVRLLKPLQRTGERDSTQDRYLLNAWPTNGNILVVLLLQAGGNFFDENQKPCLALESNARVMATLASWCTGPDRIAIDAPEFSASGNALQLRGQVIATLMPDWLAGAWKNDLPGLSGKIKLMPLPAWEKGGRRTSVWGGTMLGFRRNLKPEEFEKCWKFAQYLYRSPALAESMFRRSNIIPPDKTLWNLPAFAEPDPYFCGQASGKMYIEQAPQVPQRVSSPFFNAAGGEMSQALFKLVEYADQNKIHTVEGLLPQSRKLLGDAQSEVEKQIRRNVFLREHS
jgi:arabinosaccharide transport system substrate-binding protein